MKALIDANGNTRDHHYHNLKQGYPVQQREAQALHRLAGVPEGPCGIPELTLFEIMVMMISGITGYYSPFQSIVGP